MKDQGIVILTAAVVAVVGGGVWLFAPSLESSQRRLDRTVGVQAERARRTLDQFNAETDAVAGVLDRSGVTADLSGERVEQIVSVDPGSAQAAAEAESQRLQELLRGPINQGRQLDATYTELDPGAELPPRGVPSLGTSPDAISRDLAQAAKARDKYLAENRAQVTKAVSAASEALSEQEGDASGADSIAANRLRGSALFQEADAAARASALARDQAAEALSEMASAARMYASTQRRADIVRTSDIDAVLAARRDEVSEARKKRDAAQAVVDELAQQVAAIQQRIDEQLAISTDARAKMEALEAQGLDYSRADAAEQFAAEYGAVARAYRAAIHTESTLRYGGLENARIDDSGDYLAGEFVSATPGGSVQPIRGLDECEADLAAARQELSGRTSQLELAETHLRDSENLRASLQKNGEGASARAVEKKQRVAELWGEYQQHASAARTAEDLAVRKYAESAKAFARAEQTNRTVTTDIPADLAPDAKERSPYGFLERDGWIGAEAKCESADADVWAALVWFERWNQLDRAVVSLDAVNALVSLDGYDRAALAQAATDAKTQGAKLAEDAIQAIESSARGLDNHWTVAASVAAANYVLSLFDHPELRGLAIQNYAEVVKGRENDPQVRPYQRRLEQLQSK